MHYIDARRRATCRAGSRHGAVSPPAAAPQRAQHQRLHRLLLRPPQQPQRGEPGDRRVRLRGLRQPGATAAGAPNGTLDTGEDVNAQQHARDLRPDRRAATACSAPSARHRRAARRRSTGAGRWSTTRRGAGAGATAPILFRRALKLDQRRARQHRRARTDDRRRRTRSTSRATGTPNGDGFGDPHVGDVGHRRRGDAAVERLERQHLVRSTRTTRQSAPRAAQTCYRLAIIAGKGHVVPAAARHGDQTSAPTAARTTSCAYSRTGGQHGQLPRLDRDASSTTGRRSASYKCCADVYGAADAQLQLRHRLPDAVAAAAADAGVPRHQRARLLAGDPRRAGGKRDFRQGRAPARCRICTGPRAAIARPSCFRPVAMH